MKYFAGPGWAKIALGELGIAEVKGPKDNPRIVEYHSATSLRASNDEVPWCSSFVNWVMKKVGIKGTNSALARSWLTWGIEVSQKAPKYGSVVVLSRGVGSIAGHVGFYVGKTVGGQIKVLGGNQGDKVSVALFSKSKVLGYRWPKGK